MDKRLSDEVSDESIMVKVRSNSRIEKEKEWKGMEWQMSFTRDYEKSL